MAAIAQAGAHHRGRNEIASRRARHRIIHFVEESQMKRLMAHVAARMNSRHVIIRCLSPEELNEY